MNEIERIQQAIQRARQAQDAEAVAELEGLLAQARTQSALQGQEFNRQQEFELKPMSEREITRNREQYIANQAKEQEERKVGLTGIAGQSLSGSIEATPSGIAAGAQLGTGAYLGEARDTAQGIVRTDPGTLEGLTRTIEGISSPFSTLVGMFTPEQAPEQLEQAGQSNLQETLAIRQKNAEEIAKLKQAYVAEGGSGFAADLAQGVGGSLTSVAPLAGAAIVGGATRSPAAALIAQRTLSILPATQAYADSYAEYKAQYPNASEEDAQKYAMSMAGIEYGVEAMLPTGAGALKGLGLRQAAGAVASRTAREGLTEGATEITSQVAQRELAPELAPQSASEALYDVGLATTAGTIISTPINVAGVQAERTGLTRAQRVEQQRLAQIAAADETGKVAEGAAVVAQAEESARKGTVTESPLGPVRQEPVGPSSPFLPRAESVDLETPRAEASTLLTPAEENIGLPRGPVSVLPGQEPAAALGLDTPRGEATPLSVNPVQQARVQELTQERDALFQKGAPLTRKEKSRVKTINKELNTIAAEQASFAQRAPVDQLARTALPGPVEPALTPPAPTPLPTTRASRVEAPTQPTAAPVVREDVIDLETGKVTGEQTAEMGVPVEDTRRRELEQFFSQPRDEPLSSEEIFRNEESAVPSTGPAILPPEQRVPSDFEKRLAQVKDARGAVNAIRAYAKPGSPFARVLVALDNSPFLDNVAVKIFQPEDQLPRGLQGDTVRGSMQSYLNGRMEVHLKGSGFRNNGTSTPEIALHEIVHVASVDLINGVTEGRIKDPRAIASVKRIDGIREELKKSLEDGTLRSQLTAQERVNLDYATKNSKEFVSQALSSTAVQSGLKKEGLWSRFVSAITRFFSPERKDVPLFEKIMDASLSVIQEQTRIAPEVRESRRQDEARYMASRAERMASDQAAIPSTRLEEVRSQVLGAGTRTKPTPGTNTGQTIYGLQRKLNWLFSANKLGTAETTEAMSKSQGVIQRAAAEMQSIGRAIEQRIPLTDRKRGGSVSKAASEYLGERTREGRARIAAKLKDPELVQSLDKARATMDRLSKEVGKYIAESYQGKAMPKSVTDLLTTIKERMGSYLTRAYMVDVVPGEATDLYNDYKKGVPAAVARLQPLVDRIGGTLAGLGKWVEEARAEANLLSDANLEFEPNETVFGRETRQKYSDFLGNPGNKTIKEMFDEIDAFAKSVPESEYAKEVDRTVQKLIGVFDDTTKNDALVQFARAMRSDDRTLRQRRKVPEDLRRAWGEIVDPVLLFNLTAERTAAAYANLKSSNYLFDNAPDLFSNREDPQTNRLNRIPNNPTVYGKLAGMYTTPEVYDAVVAQVAMLPPGGVGNDITQAAGNALATTLRWLQKATGITKLTQIAMNLTNSVGLSLPNMIYMPLLNGNTNLSTLPKAWSAIQATVGTAFRTRNLNPELTELLEQGVIDPVQLQVDEEVRTRTRQARAIEQNKLVASAWNDFKAGVANPVNSLRELVNFLELLPKAWNYFSAKEELKGIYPDLTEQQIRDLAAEQTNRLNPTYTRTRNFVRGTELLQVSYTANYMEQIASNGIRSLNLGMIQARNGLATGNTKLAVAGMKKVLGNITGFTLSYGLPAAALALMGLRPEEEDEVIADNIPFSERGMQPVIISADGDRVVYADAGRANPGDTLHAPMRAIISAIANVSSGNTEEASRDFEGALNNLKGQFFGGAPLGQMMLRLVNDKSTGPQLERDIPEVYSMLVDKGGPFAGELGNIAYTSGFPAQIKGIGESATRQQKQGDEFEWNLREYLTALRAPVREVSFGDSVKFQAVAYRNAKREPSEDLKRLITLPSDKAADEARLQEEVQKLIEAQREPYEELMRSVTALRAVGARQNMSFADTEAMIRNSLKSATISNQEIESILGNAPFVPRPLSEEFGKRDIADRLARETARSERARLETLFNERLTTVKRLMEEEITKYNQGGN